MKDIHLQSCHTEYSPLDQFLSQSFVYLNASISDTFASFSVSINAALFLTLKDHFQDCKTHKYRRFYTFKLQ